MLPLNQRAVSRKMYEMKKEPDMAVEVLRTLIQGQPELHSTKHVFF